MPVTARLSRRFYETLGDDIANELVEWFNQVDATYRADLRELNELNFARFDAKLEQRIAELRAELREEIAALGGQLRAEITGLRVELRAGLAEHGTSLARQRAESIRWMFIFWTGTVVPLAGLMIALLQG